MAITKRAWRAPTVVAALAVAHADVRQQPGEERLVDEIGMAVVHAPLTHLWPVAGRIPSSPATRRSWLNRSIHSRTRR